MNVKYLCDPELHTQCPKKNCHIFGGACKHTISVEFAKQPIETVKLEFPMSDEEAKELMQRKYTRKNGGKKHAKKIKE